MENTTDDLKRQLLEALERSDTLRRNERAERILWASPHIKPVGMVVSSMEASALKEEAYECFVGGQFVATMLLCVSYIERILCAEFEQRSLEAPRNLQRLIVQARKEHLFPDELLDRADRLRELRNPFTHRRPADDPDTFGSRFNAAKVHPQTILEADAKEALALMLAYFHFALRPGEL